MRRSYNYLFSQCLVEENYGIYKYELNCVILVQSLVVVSEMSSL